MALALYLFCRREMGRILSVCGFGVDHHSDHPELCRRGDARHSNRPAMFLAMASFVRYLDTGRTFYSLGFALIASFAMLVKGTGAALALLPPLAMLIAASL